MKNNESNKNNESPKQKNVNKLTYFGSISRIMVIVFISFSLFAFVSTAMLIFLTKPKKEIQVPDLTGKKFIEIYSKIVRKGLVPKIKFKEMYDVEDGIILRQYIDAGEIVKDGTSISLLVSRSQLKFETPNLVGLSLPKAKNKLRNLHIQGKAVSLEVGTLTYVTSEKYEENRVILQSPSVKERISPDQKINILVSSGEKEKNFRLPNVTGQQIDLVYDMLVSKGCNVKIEFAKAYSMKKSGKIISQKPYRGAKFTKGMTVALKVAYYSSKGHPFFAYEKIDIKIPSDQTSGLYELIIEDLSSKRVRFSKNMKGGQSLRTIFHRKGNAKIKLLKDKKQIRAFEIGVE